MTAFLITSAAYVDSELVAEFGKLPPSFLPLGSSRLFVHQHRVIAPHASRIIMSLPEGFDPDATDRARLEGLGIEPVFLPEDLTLGESIVYAITMAACAPGPLSILHGDSLLTGFDYGALDAFSVTAKPPAGYHWAWAKRSEDGAAVLKSGAAPATGDVALNGFFSFSESSALVQSIMRNRGDFIGGLADYSIQRPMAAPESEHWFDFGHSGTYHRSRKRVTTEREFNTLKAVDRSITKMGRNKAKIEAEALWYENLPAPFRLYVPGYLGRQDSLEGGYSLEYLHLPSLTDLSVFGRLGVSSWERIFRTCDEVLTAMSNYRVEAESVTPNDLYFEKTMQRLELFATERSLDLTAPCRFAGHTLPSLFDIVEMVTKEIPGSFPQTLVHGDFCFSNILYDMRSDLVRMIDPRGLDSRGNASIYGDLRYDIAKLYHSAVGLYDHIIAENYSLNQSGPLDFDLQLPDTSSVNVIRDAFSRQSFAGMSPALARSLPIAILLFLSMPPLHAESPARQNALLANGLRLFSLFDRKGLDAT